MQNKPNPQVQIKKLIREANKLIRRYVNMQTNPLGVPEYADVQLHRFTTEVHDRLARIGKEHLTHQITDWIDATSCRASLLASYQYHRPRVRGRDGNLYSQSDMDNAMMYH